MKTKIILSFLLSLVLGFGILAQDATVGGVTFPSKLKMGDNSLTYNGAGIRTKYLMKLYVSGLYLQKKNSNDQEVIDQNELSAIRLVITSGMVTREKFVETVRDGFKTSTDGKASEEEIGALMKLFDGVEFEKGYEVLLVYRPTSGIEVYLNKKHLGGVKGLEFKKALWSIWLGSKPADKTLKKGMLGA